MGWFCSECRRFRRVAGRFEGGDGVVVAVVDNVGKVDGSVDVADGGCVAVVGGDVAVVMELGGLISGAVGARVSLQACEAALQVLGGSVDVPVSFSRRGRSSLGAVCITASTAVNVVVWVLESVVMRVVGSVCMPSSILIFAFFISHALRSAVLPRSTPSFIPFSYPSSNSAVFPFSSDLEIASLTTEYASSRPRATIAS